MIFLYIKIPCIYNSIVQLDAIQIHHKGSKHRGSLVSLINIYLSSRMGNSLRCCLSCILPCGALDLIRIVHLDGHVEEFTRPVTAGEVLSNNPNHILSTPCSLGVSRRILILSPETELKRGSIYFLIPSSSLPQKKKHAKDSEKILSEKPKNVEDIDIVVSSECEPCPEDVTSVKKHSRTRTSSRSGVWLPQLESIHEG